MSRPVQRVLVVGRDAAAWIAALALRRALQGSEVTVQLLELPSLLRPVDVYAALPALHGLNRLLGIEEEELLAVTGSVPVIGRRYANFARSKPPFLVGYDTPIPTGVEVGFVQLWLKARMEGLQVAFEDFSLAAAAAKQGRIPGVDEAPGPFSAAPGYHIDALPYVELLRRRALRSGVQLASGVLEEVVDGPSGVEAIVLAGGERLTADLFVDASGAEATLIGRMEGANWTSWAEWLPCDRLLAASAPRLPQLPAFSEISAFAAGWIGLHPLQQRTAVVACYRSGDMTEDDMVARLSILAGLPVGGDAFVTPLNAGMRERSWVGNVVALGDAAVVVDPIEPVSLHLVHVGLSHLLALFPADAGEMVEAVAFNRSLASHAANIRDFAAAHYKLNRRYDDPFWDRVRQAQGPEALDERIRVFASRGLVPLREDETFQEGSWTALLLGHGIVPASYDPRVDLLPQEQHIARIQQRLHDISGQVRAMPTVEAYLAAARPGGR